jgi:hypothetical protein
VPLWWEALVMGRLCVWRQGVDGKSLYFPLNFAVNLKLLFKKKKNLNKQSNKKVKPTDERSTKMERE